MNGLDVYRRFKEAGYRLWLEDGEIRAAGPASPTPELRALVNEHRDSLKAAILLMNSPSWLVRLLNLYKFENDGTAVRRTSPSGKTETYVVKLQLRNIAAAIAADTGLGYDDLERIYPEIEEAIAMCKGDGKVVPLRVAGVGR